MRVRDCVMSSPTPKTLWRGAGYCRSYCGWVMRHAGGVGEARGWGGRGGNDCKVGGQGGGGAYWYWRLALYASLRNLVLF